MDALAKPWVLAPTLARRLFLDPGPLGEEPGWRGFALPRLLAGRSALGASLILGAIWAAWRLPAFLLGGTPQAGLSLPAFVASAKLDPAVALAFVAAHTTRLRLATGITILPQRNPVVLAKELASVDVVSRGRLVFGIGAGYLEPEFAAVGAPFADRGARTDLARSPRAHDHTAADGAPGRRRPRSPSSRRGDDAPRRYAPLTSARCPCPPPQVPRPPEPRPVTPSVASVSRCAASR